MTTKYSRLEKLLQRYQVSSGVEREEEMRKGEANTCNITVRHLGKIAVYWVGGGRANSNSRTFRKKFSLGEGGSSNLWTIRKSSI